MTTNNVANYIAAKGITKHMSREAACAVWNDLKSQGWERDGIMLTKHDENGVQRFFTFEKVNTSKVKVSFMELEVVA
jgi:hypothetical protein